VGGDFSTLHEYQAAPICRPGLTEHETREHRANCGGTFISDEIGRHLESTRSPEPRGCEVQTMLPQRVERRRRVDESRHHVGKPELFVGAPLSRRGP
jgi:hypothetical protein